MAAAASRQRHAAVGPIETGGCLRPCADRRGDRHCRGREGYAKQQSHDFLPCSAMTLIKTSGFDKGKAMADTTKPGAVKKVVLAYSGGLDTSIILKWLQQTYRCEVVTFTADLGQGDELSPAKEKALLLGVKPENIFIEDLREEFVRDFVFPMFRANTVYEGQYLLGTAIARPLIAKAQIDLARAVGADAVCHGATGKVT